MPAFISSLYITGYEHLISEFFLIASGRHRNNLCIVTTLIYGPATFGVHDVLRVYIQLIYYLIMSNIFIYDFSEAKDAMGALSCWSQDQQSAWFATYQIIYGDDPSAWDDEVTAGLGTVLGGAPAETLAQLSPEQMQNMEPDVVASIPPESFNVSITEKR